MAVPDSAIKITYGVGEKKFYYFVWMILSDKWAWEALGNNGYAPSQEDAMSCARRWIRDNNYEGIR